MSGIDIRTLDLTQYQSAPMLTVNGLLRLISDLDRAKPKDAPAFVLNASATMVGTAAQIEARMLERVDGAGVDSKAEFDFDVSCDRFWIDVRDQLEHRMQYGDDALLQLKKSSREKIDLEHRRDMAVVAKELHNHLFGLDGTDFLRLPFNEQVVQMARRLEFIHKSPKAMTYEELLGEGLLTTLGELQIHYDEMVHSRTMRDKTVTNIKELRHTAQRHITLYASTVLATMDEQDPDSVERAIEALRPIRSARLRRGSPSSDAGETGEGEGEGVGEGEALVEDLEEAPVTP